MFLCFGLQYSHHLNKLDHSMATEEVCTQLDKLLGPDRNGRLPDSEAHAAPL